MSSADEENKIVAVVNESANTFSIGTKDDVEKGQQILRDIKSVEDIITKRKQEITRPLMEGLASARELFKPQEVALAEAKSLVKSKILEYETRVEAEEAKLTARVERGTMKPETALAKMEDMKANVNSRVIRKLKITDETAIPRLYLVPDRERITRDLFRGVPIAGAELVEEKIIVTK